MINRRDFLKTSILAGNIGLIKPAFVFASGTKKTTGYFGVHPFVEMHPEAVFIMRTNVDIKTNSEACKNVGLDFGRTVFVPTDNSGMPVSSNIATKPNITAHRAVDEKRGMTIDDTMGICTDTFFVEGLFESLKELGIKGKSLHTRDINGNRVIEPRGYTAMGERTGATVASDKTRIRTAEDANDSSAFVWKEVPDGVIHEQIPFMWPFNAADSWNLNLAKFKAHTMGLTLACKNWQGADASPFQGYCQKWPTLDRIGKLEKELKKDLINPKAHDLIEANLKRHMETIPRWNTPVYKKDTPGYVRLYGYDTLCMELWAQRTVDNHSVSPMGLHVIEGIYGRDGDFNHGPNPFGSENNKDPWLNAPSKNGRAWDYMTNIVVFGKNPYLVDNIGHWLGGHEPGNFGLFHIAMERGKVDMLNPMNIPVYEWMDGVAVRRPLTSFSRTPLRTSYLQQHHTDEPLWHLVNEPFDYSTITEKKLDIPSGPTSRILNRHYPSSSNPKMTIEYSIPVKGEVLIEILDKSENNIEVIVNSINDAGYHMAAWNTDKFASGNYKYRLRFKGFNEVKELVLNKA